MNRLKSTKLHNGTDRTYLKYGKQILPIVIYRSRINYHVNNARHMSQIFQSSIVDIKFFFYQRFLMQTENENEICGTHHVLCVISFFYDFIR